MSDYNDQYRRDSMYDPNARGNSAGRWLVGLVFIAVIIGLLVAFGHPAHHNSRVAQNTAPMTHTTPVPPPPAGSPATPMAPTPTAPAHP
jgi:hypothetical protein